MRIFISHAKKNMEIVLKFAELLEAVSSEIEVFCTSEEGSIMVGKNCITTIFDELNASDLFIPILSKEYYESRFCMIELGVAYSYLFQKYEKRGEEYIFPFALYPVTKGQALSSTPMAHIQTGELNNEEDIRSLFEYLDTERGIHIGVGANRKLHSFKTELDWLLLKKQNLMEMARIGTYFDDNIDYKCKADVVGYSTNNNAVVVNYNLNPYERKNVKYPNFISVVFRYADKIDLGRYQDFNDAAELCFVLTSFTNSLNKIFVEFKCSDSNRLLETFQLSVKRGENKLRIPLKEMRSRALSQISEICFVIHPEDVSEEEGMFQIGEIEVR